MAENCSNMLCCNSWHEALSCPSQTLLYADTMLTRASHVTSGDECSYGNDGDRSLALTLRLNLVLLHQLLLPHFWIDPGALLSLNYQENERLWFSMNFCFQNALSCQHYAKCFWLLLCSKLCWHYLPRPRHMQCWHLVCTYVRPQKHARKQRGNPVTPP